MIDGQEKRVRKAVTDMIQDMYKTHLRKMQCDMHLCAVNCCDDLMHQPTLENVQTCIEECTIPLVRAQDYVQHELGEFQAKLQSCVMECNDENFRGSVVSKTHESGFSKYRHQFEICTVKCVDKHLGLIPSMMQSIKTVLANGPNHAKEA